jgi:hypothetical protein
VEMLNSQESLGERALKTWRGLIALLYASKSIGRFSFSQAELCKAISLNDIDLILMNECFQFVDVRRRRGHGQRPSATVFEEVCKDFAASNSLAGVECLKGDRSSWNERDRQRTFHAPLPEELIR